jgi:predicted methyltransferase
MRPAAFACALLLLGVAAPAMAALPPAVTQALAESGRPQADRDADASRAPGETLGFVGVKPGMTVIELYPGGGYFTRPLSALVGPKGQVVAVENAGWKGAAEADRKMMATLGRSNVRLEVLPFGELPASAPPADVFWITQNYHDLKIAEYGKVDTAAFNRRVFQMLKPGGVYFILDHEATGPLTAEQIAKLHRIDKAIRGKTDQYALKFVKPR